MHPFSLHPLLSHIIFLQVPGGGWPKRGQAPPARPFVPRPGGAKRHQEAMARACLFRSQILEKKHGWFKTPGVLDDWYFYPASIKGTPAKDIREKGIRFLDA
jgi:hypothetical protein